MNRVDGIPDVSGAAVKSVPLPATARETYAAIHAEAAVALNKREGFLRGVKAAIGVPDAWGFNQQSLVFEPPKGAIVEHPEPGENGGVET